MIFLFVVAITAYPAAFGQGTGPIVLIGVGCTGTESSLLRCRHRELDDFFHRFYWHFLYHNDVGVVCPSCKSCFNKKAELLSQQLNKLGASNCEW